MRLGEWNEMSRELTKEATRGGNRRPMAADDVRLYLGGYLSPFGLRAPVSTYTGRDGGAWLLPGLAAWWERPGPPAVPQAELAREEMGRLNFILREVFATAAARGELHLLTHKTGRDRQFLLYRCGLGAYA